MAENGNRHREGLQAYELFRRANPLFAPDTRLVLRDNHPKYTSDAVARTINRTLGQLANTGVLPVFDNKKAHSIVQQFVSDPHSKKADNLGIQPGQTIVFDPFDPNMGLVPSGVQLPFRDFPITISRDDTGYTASLPFIGTEAINPFRAEAYVQLTQLSAQLTAPKEEKLRLNHFWEQVNQAITALNLKAGPQHERMYEGLDRTFLQQLAEKTGKTMPVVLGETYSPRELETAIKKLIGRRNMPNIVLPFQGTFNNNTGNGIETFIDVTSNPIEIGVDSYLDGVQLVPDWRQITHTSTTLTAIGNWRAPIKDLIKGKLDAKILTYGMHAFRSEMVYN